MFELKADLAFLAEVLYRPMLRTMFLVLECTLLVVPASVLMIENWLATESSRLPLTTAEISSISCDAGKDVLKIHTFLLSHFPAPNSCNRSVRSTACALQANIKASGETMYDQRLFNQEGGMASGLASDDTYNLYDKALFADRGNNLYKPKTANPDDEAADPSEKDRVFKPDKVRPLSKLLCTLQAVCKINPQIEAMRCFALKLMLSSPFT